MDAKFWATVVAIVVAIVVPVGISIARSARARRDRDTKRLDDHITEDIKAHERIARIEIRVDRLEQEQDSMRRRFHDFRENTLKELWQLFADWKDQIIAMFKRDR